NLGAAFEEYHGVRNTIRVVADVGRHVAEASRREGDVGVACPHVSAPVARQQVARHGRLARHVAAVGGHDAATRPHGGPGDREKFGRLRVVEVMEESVGDDEVEARGPELVDHLWSYWAT